MARATLRHILSHRAVGPRSRERIFRLRTRKTGATLAGTCPYGTDDWLDGRPAGAMAVSIGASVTEQIYFTWVDRSLYTLNLITSDGDTECPHN